jgi:Domain of unknown function (DUF4279)
LTSNVPIIETWLLVRGAPPTEAQRVTDLTSLTPTRIARQGDGVLRLESLRGATGLWWTWSLREGPLESFDHPGQIARLLNRVEPAAHELGRLASAHGCQLAISARAKVFDAIPDWAFESPLLSRIVRLGATLEIAPLFP